MPRWGAGIVGSYDAIAEHEVRAALEGAGFRIDELAQRPPYDFEYPSTRIYAVATRQ